MGAVITTADPAQHHRGDEAHLLREIVRTHQVMMARFSRAVGMPASQLAVLRLLAVSDRELGVMELSRQLGINAAAVTRQVKDLEREGFVRRHADPRDGRRSHVGLSAKGRRRFLEIHARNHELERSLVSILNASDIAVAVRVLTRLREFLERMR